MVGYAFPIMASKDFQFRYYENEMPDVGSVVMVKVESMEESMCYVRLLEYNNIEGMIPFTELSRRRIRSMSQLAKVGRVLIATVIRVDKEKRYIDLSKKQVTAEERRLCEDRYWKAKTVVGIMCTAALELKMLPIDLMNSVAWPLYRNGTHAYDQLKRATLASDEVLTKLNLPKPVYDQLEATIKQKLKAETLKIEADLNVTCFTPEGVDAIREVLLYGQGFVDKSEAVGLITVHVLAPPTYSLYTFTENKDDGIARLGECIDAMLQLMTSKGGNLEVVKPPHVVGHEGGDQPAVGVADDSSGEGEEA
jgi:translation initiation factor 2 subunit 1